MYLTAMLQVYSICIYVVTMQGLILKTFLGIMNANPQDKSMKENIILASCGSNESLPINAQFPMDLFTSCLTTPIRVALRWFLRNNRLLDQVTEHMIENIPGRITDRRTPLGELNWIFTAVTDTIAWNVLPRDLFHKLFRQDLLVASLFRNFLLADRIMRSLHVTPVSYPALPPTHNHPMWQAWDLAVDTCLSQLPSIFAAAAAANMNNVTLPHTMSVPIMVDEDGIPIQASTPTTASPMHGTTTATPTDMTLLEQYQFSSFFSAQLTDFEVWLRFGARSMLWNDAYYQQIHGIMMPSSMSMILDANLGKSLIPKQLPILLQVLLSQVHRLKALSLLGRFLDMGPWAVNLALAVGIFPYVVKLLSSISPELKQILVFIWVKILALDKSCQADLIKDNGHIYFINLLATKSHALAQSLGIVLQLFGLFLLVATATPTNTPTMATSATLTTEQIKDALQLKTMCAFVLSVMVDKHPAGQTACLQYKNLLSICVSQLHEDDKNLRKWLLLLIGKLVQDFEAAQEEAFKAGIHGNNIIDVLCLEKLIHLLDDAIPEVRAAAICALQCFLFDGEKHATRVMAEFQIGSAMIKLVTDGSSLVRRECLICMSTLILRYGTWIQGTLLQGMLMPHAATTTHTTNTTTTSAQQQNSLLLGTSPATDEQSLMHDDYDWNKTLFVMDLIKMVQFMTQDPMPDIAKSANHVLILLKHTHVPQAVQDESEQQQQHDSRKSYKLSKDYKSAQRRSKSPVVDKSKQQQQPATQQQQPSLMNSFMKRSSSEPNFQTAMQEEGNASNLQLPTYPESTLYDIACQWYSLPMLAENQQQLPYCNELLTTTMNMIPDPACITLEGTIIAPPSTITTTTTDATTTTTTTTTSDQAPPITNPLNYIQMRKQRRYEQLIKEALTMYKTAGKKKLEEQIGFFGNEDDVVCKMKFHAYDPLLIVSDDHDGLTVWNWLTGKKMNSFKCGNRIKGKISGTTIIVVFFTICRFSLVE